MAARVDIGDPAYYFNRCLVLENFFVWRQGPADRRPGTRFVAEVKSSAAKTRLIPFEYSTAQAYVIEAGNQYFRFYKDGGRIETAGTPVEVASPTSRADLPRLMWCQSADVLYLFHPAYQPRKLSRTSHTAWTLDVIDFIDGPWLEENLAPARRCSRRRPAASSASSPPGTRRSYPPTWAGWCASSTDRPGATPESPAIPRRRRSSPR
jgi:hypothetical protein